MTLPPKYANAPTPRTDESEDIREPLWNAINEYVIACGGDPSKHVYGNTRRQRAVVAVESIVCHQNKDRQLERELLYARDVMEKMSQVVETFEHKHTKGKEAMVAYTEFQQATKQ